VVTCSMNKWDRRFFELCRLVGSWSEDESRRVGCVIVGSANEVRTIGYNGLPRGVSGDVSARQSREGGEKYHWFERAERNAIFNAARIGVSIANCRIYVGLHPCAECARAVIQSGIKSVHTFTPPSNDLTFRRSFEVADEMFREAEIDLFIYEPII
jgi:dCMP deaminase